MNRNVKRTKSEYSEIQNSMAATTDISWGRRTRDQRDAIRQSIVSHATPWHGTRNINAKVYAERLS